MKVFVVLGHPTKGSLNHAIAEQTVQTLRKNGHEVLYHDLYEEGFDPVLESQEISREAALTEQIEKHCSGLAVADGVVIVHPIWWEMPPAILKGWVDRVVRPGVAYEFKEVADGEGASVGLLNVHTVLVLNTCNTPPGHEIKSNPLSAIWNESIFGNSSKKGLAYPYQFFRKTYAMVVTSTLEERKEWLVDVQATVDKYFPRGR